MKYLTLGIIAGILSIGIVGCSTPELPPKHHSRPPRTHHIEHGKNPRHLPGNEGKHHKNAPKPNKHDLM